MAFGEVVLAIDDTLKSNEIFLQNCNPDNNDVFDNATNSISGSIITLRRGGISKKISFDADCEA
ncbi:hypothetical protein FPZ49_23740 [Paenibacillus cremeus]|uniref:Uncharacterized protein n=2 Tax=Paenibacillus cremeus TaxID=2163881 RepID=A0A559K5U1_9BACL|nr:hypothetical protein FPZ49_23740 [Paenibacillus cremeus]